MKHVLSCSFGKDSVATAVLAKKHGEPLDEAIFCEVMFTEKISGEVPEHRDFIYNIAIPKFNQWGIKTTVIRAERNYVSEFTRKVTRGTRKGKIWSFPLCGRCYMQRDCKVRPINAYKKTLEPGTVQYIGIAHDERERLLRLEGIQAVSLLDKYKVTETRAFELCESEGLLSPVYDFTDRGGCWFCPNAKEKELRHLYDRHKELWNAMLDLQSMPNKATELFNRNEKFCDIDRRFKADDAQIRLF